MSCTTEKQCPSGMSPNSGGLCVYDNGACRNLTINGCKAWKYDAQNDSKKGRAARLAWLQTKAFIEYATSAGILLVLGIVQFVMAVKAGDVLKLSNAVLTIVSAFMSFAMYIGKAIGGKTYQMIAALVGTFTLVMGTARFLMGIITGALWWLQPTLKFGVATMESALEGPVALLQNVALGFLGKGGEALIKAGANFAQTLAIADEASYKAQMGVSIGDWCAQHGGCPAANPAIYNQP